MDREALRHQMLDGIAHALSAPRWIVNEEAKALLRANQAVLSMSVPGVDLYLDMILEKLNKKGLKNDS